MKRQEIVRLVGTLILTVVTAPPYVAGAWMAWAYLLSELPMPFGIMAMMGIIVAPVQLVRDILAADRVDRKSKKEEIAEE